MLPYPTVTTVDGNSNFIDTYGVLHCSDDHYQDQKLLTFAMSKPAYIHFSKILAHKSHGLELVKQNLK